MDRSDDSDEDLVRRFCAGDEEAGRVLFSRLSSTLRPRARRRIGPGLRSKVGESDLIQSAFAAVIRRLPEFRDGGAGSFHRWLAGILDHKGIDEVRRYQGRARHERGRELGVDALSERSIPSAAGPSPSGGAMAQEQRRRIQAALSQLTTDHRTVVRLIHEDRMSVGGAAVAMQRSYEATRKLYARALERLAVLLKVEDAS